MGCGQTCKYIALNYHRERVYNWFCIGDFDTIFKVICGFVLKMMLALQLVNGFFQTG